MRFYDFFLKICGLIKIISKNKSNNSDNSDDENESNAKDIIISIDESNNITRKVISNNSLGISNKSFKLIINLCYLLFVLSILSWIIISAIVESIIQKDGRYISSNMFTVMYLLQYITGIIFYRTKFYKNTMKNMKNQYTTFYILYIGSFILSITLGLSAIIFLVNDLNINIYTKYYNVTNTVGKVFLSIVLALDKFYAYNIYFINMIIFVLILTNLKCKINLYKKKLEDVIGNNEINITISDMIKEYVELQACHKKSVNSLNKIFTSITIFGLIGCYFTIINFNTDFVGIFSYIDLAFYLILDCVYFYSINNIRSVIDDIKSVIGSPKFVIKFLSKSEMTGFSGDVYNDYVGDIDEYDEIELDIIEPQDKKKTKRVNRMSYSIKQPNNTRELNKKLDVVKNMLYRNIILNTENSADLDWIILYNKLLEPWECFKVFGFDISDDELVQKFISIVLGMFGILQLNGKIGFY